MREKGQWWEQVHSLVLLTMLIQLGVEDLVEPQLSEVFLSILFIK